jgi:cytochrome b
MWVLLIVAALLVLVIAWFAVNLVTARLAATPSMAIFDIEEATRYVADNLPGQVAAKLSHDDVRLLLRWQLTYLRERGVATFGQVDEVAEWAALAAKPVVADEDELVDELLERARAERFDVEALDIVCVTDLTADYLVAIGAIGAVVDESALPELGGGTAGELPE